MLQNFQRLFSTFASHLHALVAKLQSMQKGVRDKLMSESLFFKSLIDCDCDQYPSKMHSYSTLADQSHGSLPFKSEILLTVWSEGFHFICS